MTPNQQKTEVARKFLTGLRDHDWSLLKSLMTKDVVWILPGNSPISGEVAGPAAVVQRAERIVNHRLTFTLKNILVGQHGVAMTLRNTAWLRDMLFDEHLTTVFSLRHGKICEINTYLSDVRRFNAFFKPFLPALYRPDNLATNPSV